MKHNHKMFPRFDGAACLNDASQDEAVTRQASRRLDAMADLIIQIFLR